MASDLVKISSSRQAYSHGLRARVISHRRMFHAGPIAIITEGRLLLLRTDAI